MKELKLGVYKHYKGEYHLVLGLGRHTETEEKFVVYVPLFLREGPRIALRPLEMFLDKVKIDGKIQPRFRYIGQEIAIEQAKKSGRTDGPAAESVADEN